MTNSRFGPCSLCIRCCSRVRDVRARDKRVDEAVQHVQLATRSGLG